MNGQDQNRDGQSGNTVSRIRNIAVSGDIGTGKTTLAKNLAERLGFRHLHAGEYFRKWHKLHNLPLDQTEKIPPQVDREMDFDYQRMMSSEDKIVFESHLAGWLAKDLEDVFKILCVADIKVSMERAAKRDGVSVEEAKKNAKLRSEALTRKFKKLYGVKNHLDPKYFDLVIDTTNKTPEEVLRMALEKIQAKE